MKLRTAQVFRMNLNSGLTELNKDGIYDVHLGGFYFIPLAILSSRAQFEGISTPSPSFTSGRTLDLISNVFSYWSSSGRRKYLICYLIHITCPGFFLNLLSSSTPRPLRFHLISMDYGLRTLRNRSISLPLLFLQEGAKNFVE